MSYHLAYLDLRARGEPVRWVLKAVKIEYTEERIDLMTEWPNRKKDFNWGRTPVLIINGQQLHQTTVICRYMAETHDFVSRDLWTATRQQEVAEGVHDITNLMADVLFARLRKDEVRQKYMTEKVKERIPEVFENVEGAISHDGWIYSDKMNWVDAFVACYIDLYSAYFPGIFDAFPKSIELMKRVMDLPQITAWIKKRPQWNAFEKPEGI